MTMPELHLLKPDPDDLLALYTKLTGKQPTAAERADVVMRLASAKQPQTPSGTASTPSPTKPTPNSNAPS